MWRLGALVLAVAAIYLVVSAVQVLHASTTSRSPTAVGLSRAIVVIGTPNRGSVAKGELVARCDQAILLWSVHRARTVIVTGGPTIPGAPTEAALSARCLEAAGVPKRAIVEMPESDVAVALASVAARYGAAPARTGTSGAAGHHRPAPRVIVVAAPLQTLWLGHLATSEGLAAQVSPATNTKGGIFGSVSQILRQALAVSLGRVIGYPRTVALGN
jgi:hypothetical protein